jgi:hypothetical protein
MLTQSSAAIGTNLAEILVSSGIKLVPKQQTLLSELNNALTNNIMAFPAEMCKDFIAPSLVSGSTGNENTIKGVKSYVGSSHDSYMDNYIEDLSKLVTGYISFARTVVNKAVTLLREELNESLSSYKYKEPEDFFDVKYFKLGDVFNSYIVSNEIVPYSESRTKFVFESLNLNKIQDESFELDKYLLTGDAEQDVGIQAWIGEVGLPLIKNYLLGVTAEFYLSRDELLNCALANYLFYRNLTEKNDLDLGYSSSVLRVKSSSNRDYYGNMLVVNLELYHKDIRNGKILTSNSDVAFSYFNEKPLKITIYEESLAKLAEAGLGIDVVFGFISGGIGSNDVTVDKLIADSANYLNKWTNTRSLYLISLDSSRLDIFKQLLRERYEASLKISVDMNTDETEFLNANSGFLEESRVLGNKYIDQLHTSDLDDVDKIVLVLVASIRYRFTNAYFILKDMSEILKRNDKAEPQEAALYSTIKYLVDHLLTQVDVVKV